MNFKDKINRYGKDLPDDVKADLEGIARDWGEDLAEISLDEEVEMAGLKVNPEYHIRYDYVYTICEVRAQNVDEAFVVAKQALQVKTDDELVFAGKPSLFYVFRLTKEWGDEDLLIIHMLLADKKGQIELFKNSDNQKYWEHPCLARFMATEEGKKILASI